MNQKALTPLQASSRFARLEELENNIKTSVRRGLNAAISMGKDFDTIKQEELYQERGCESFNRYVDAYTDFPRTTVERLIAISQSAQLIEDAGLVLPANESQLAELAKLEPEQQKIIWRNVLQLKEEDITARNIRKAIEILQRKRAERQEQEEEQKSTRGGVKTPLDKDEDKNKGNGEQDKNKPSAKPVAPDRIRLSQEGEDALDRIRTLCGEETATGIETCCIAISERDLIKWADQSDVVVKNLAHYIVDLRWSVRKAVDYEERIIDGESTLSQLIILARARGGSVTIEHQDYNEEYRITIERTRVLEA